MTSLWWAGKCQDAQHKEPCHSPKLTANMVPTTLIAGRKEQNRNLGIQLARRGYIVFIPDYRLVPETDIFGQISDILDALAVIEAKATEFRRNTHSR